MENTYTNYLNTERSVEIPFIVEMLEKYCKKESKLLDVGGIPSVSENNKPIFNALENLKTKEFIIYDICDFRGGRYKGDFVNMDFQDNKFNIIIFLSSLEHFPQCTEGDVIYRGGEDVKGFKKALSILEDKGLVFLTIPFGKPIWQPYHQNYNWELLQKLTKGSTIIENHIYTLFNKDWVKVIDPSTMENVLYTDKAHGVGCFVLQKD
jgi:hypothetical protein